MKKLFISLFTVLILASCGGSKKENKKQAVEEVTAEDNSMVKNLDYKHFIKNIWDIEKHPDSFAYKGKLPCIIDFYADWCGPCKKVAPIMEELAKEYEERIIVYKVNTDNEPKLSTIFQIRNIPTVFFLPKEGQPMMQVGALSKEEYNRIINQHLIK